MPYSFRKAVRENTTVLVGLAGYTGTGKTMSMLRLAQGLRGDGKMLMLDTEAGRGTHYADRFDYDYAEIKPPFSPQTYRDAIEQADEAGYRVICIDSMSHEWAGDGGCADIQAESLHRMSGGDARKMERLTAPSWRDAKLAHKRMMSRLLQCRGHLIFGLRAEPKIKFVKVRGDDGRERTVIEDAGYQPICEKSFMFEMTVSFMLNEQHLPVPIKLGEQFKAMFPLDQPITEKSGEMIAEWARGGAVGRVDTVAERETQRGPQSSANVSAADQPKGDLGTAPLPEHRHAPAGSPEDDRAGYIAMIESAKPAIVTLKKKQLFGNPNIDHRAMELSSLQTLALAVKG